MLSELAVVARGQPCLIVGDLKIEPAKIPCLLKGIVAGFWVDLQEAWATASESVTGAALPAFLQLFQWNQGDFVSFG